MKKYIGTKIIKAKSATYKEFCLEKYGEYVESKDVNKISGKAGYIVQYSDNYVIWSPKEAFDEAYRQTDNMNFGLAIESMKKGHKVARQGWNDKGMWITISPGYKDLPAEKFWNDNNKNAAELAGGKTDVLPYVTMKTADNKILCGWLASQTDMLSDDWIIV